MTSKAINFTIQAISKLPLPEAGKRSYYKDTQQKGLLLDIRSSGTMSFYVYKKIKGRPERIFLGTYPDLSVENARKNAKITIGLIAQGKNPQDDARHVRNETTLKQLFEDYMTRHSKLNKKSWLYDEREIKKFLSHWFNRKISDIYKTDIQKLHEKIRKENGLYQANRILERTRSLFNKAIEWGWEGTNPVIGIKKFKETSRDRFVQPIEMPYLIQSIECETNKTIRDYLWTLLLTGARKTNVMTMRWEQFDFTRSEWRIPETKNGEPLRIPLVSRATDILLARKEASESEWVFPQEDDSKKHIVNVKRAWNRTLERATLYLWRNDDKLSKWIVATESKIPQHLPDEMKFDLIVKKAEEEEVTVGNGLRDLRLHDIRRTFGSYQAITGASLQVIGKSLGHKSQQATQIYARLNLDPVRVAIERATEAMFQI